MSTITVDEYFRQKKEYLKQCLYLSEELLGSIENWDAVPDILSRKEAVILRLKDLEEACFDLKVSLTQEMKADLDQTIRQILDLDQNTAKLIRKEQQDVKSSLKANINGQKLMQYAQLPEAQSGRRFDYKK